jgi:hypothetical protein
MEFLKQPDPVDNDILEIHLYECGHIVKKPCNDLVCPICEQIGRTRDRLEIIREFTPSSALDENLPDGDKVKCYEMGYEDALGDICVLITEILSQPQPAPVNTGKGDNNASS